MSYNYDSEDSAATRDRKLEYVIADARRSDASRDFWLSFVCAWLLPIIPLAYILAPPLWSKWTLPGVLGVVLAWGGFLIIGLITKHFLV